MAKLNWERANQRERFNKHGTNPVKQPPKNLLRLKYPAVCGNCHVPIGVGQAAIRNNLGFVHPKGCPKKDRTM